MGIADTRSRARLEQSRYSNVVREFGRGSPQAIAAEGEYWCVRLCTLLEDSIAEHPLTDDHRRRIADAALTAGGAITGRLETGESVSGEVFGSPSEPN